MNFLTKILRLLFYWKAIRFYDEREAYWKDRNKRQKTAFRS